MCKKLCILLLFQLNPLFATVPLQHTESLISDWIALGSGCRGDSKNNEGLKMNVIEDPKNPFRLEVQFFMGSYSLSGDKPIRKKNQSFARECSLRFAVTPKVNTRVKNVEAKTTFFVQKDKGAHVEIHSRLVAAKGSLANWEQKYKTDEVLKKESLAMYLVPNQNGKSLLNETLCGAPKIFGADFTFENHRKSFEERVEIRHAGDRQVHFIIELESCY